jgi:hypothetical protein
MNCRKFTEQLEEMIEGHLSTQERRAISEHLRRCAACRRLDVVVREELAAPAAEIPSDLTSAILRHTSGSPCQSATDRICDFVDGTLGDIGSSLMRGHLDGCGDCAALSRVVFRLDRDLPYLSERAPDAKFVSDVLAGTLPGPLVTVTWLKRLTAGWQQLVTRPRFAWEGAYVGMFVLLLLFGTPYSPWNGAPEKVLALAALNPVAELSEPAAALKDNVGTGLRSAMEITRANVIDPSQKTAKRVADQSSSTLRKVRNRSVELWNTLTSDSDEKTDNNESPPEPGDQTQGDRP